MLTESKTDFLQQIPEFVMAKPVKKPVEIMTEELCMQIVDEMLEEVIAWLRYKVAFYLNSNIIHVNRYKKGRYLPRILLSAALYEMAKKYRPTNRAGSETVNLLKRVFG